MTTNERQSSLTLPRIRRKQERTASNKSTNKQVLSDTTLPLQPREDTSSFPSLGAPSRSRQSSISKQQPRQRSNSGKRLSSKTFDITLVGQLPVADILRSEKTIRTRIPTPIHESELPPVIPPEVASLPAPSQPSKRERFKRHFKIFGSQKT